MKAYISVGLLALLSAWATVVNAAPVTYKFSGSVANGYTLTGRFSIDNDALADYSLAELIPQAALEAAGFAFQRLSLYDPTTGSFPIYTTISPAEIAAWDSIAGPDYRLTGGGRLIEQFDTELLRIMSG